MRSFVPTTLMASAALFTAVQGEVTVTKPAEGDTVDASKGFDIVWTYGESDPTDWTVELGNPIPGKILAGDVKPDSAEAGQTATFTYTVKPTHIADGKYRVILDPHGKGLPGQSLPQSGEFTVGSGGDDTTTTTTTSSSSSSTGSVTTSTSSSGSTTSTGVSTSGTTGTPGTPTPSPSGTSTGSGSVVPPNSASSKTTISSVISSTIVSGTHTTVVPQSTVFETTVVPANPTGSGSPTATTTTLPTNAAAGVEAGLGSAVLMALLPAFLL